MIQDELHGYLLGVLEGYGLAQPKLTFLRHSENRTYRVDDIDGSAYLLRVSQPLKASMAGLQHTYGGLRSELKMLDQLAAKSRLKIQKPLRNQDGDWITVFEHEGKRIHCSMLTWLEGRDLQKDDVKDPGLVRKLGTLIGELHAFYREYRLNDEENRPSQGIKYNQSLVTTIKEGYKLGLFTLSDVATIESCIWLINSRLEALGKDTEAWGLIHGDLGMGNIIISPGGELGLIDFGFFGTGYYLLDVAMTASMLPSELRDTLLAGYFGSNAIQPEDMLLLEGFMLIGIIGYYAFQMGNESVYGWMKERMPLLCSNYCLPFLSGDRIFYTI